MSTDAHGSNQPAGESTAGTDQQHPEPAPEPGHGRDVATYDADAGAIVVPTPVSGLALTFTRDQRTLTAEQMHVLAPIGIEANWDPAQVMVFLMLCAERGFNPWAREAYLLPIDGKLIHHIGIGGLRRQAEETGEYVGRVGPQWCGPDGVWRDVWLDKTTAPAAARVGILRRGFDGPVWGIATYDEFAPMIDEAFWQDDPNGAMKDGRPKRVKVKTGRRAPAANWKPARDGGKPSVMIAKCAEAAGFRAAFPAKFGGFYVREETERLDVEAPDRAGRGTDRPDPARERRRAAMDAADAAAAHAGPQPMFVGLGIGDDDARRLLVAELDEQAHILGKTRAEVTARWVASRGGLPFDRWQFADVVKLVHVIRPHVLAALREQGRDAEADRYMNAPPVGDAETLFGRGRVVIEQDEPAAVPA